MHTAVDLMVDKPLVDQNLDDSGNRIAVWLGLRHCIHNVFQVTLLELPKHLHHLLFCFCQ